MMKMESKEELAAGSRQLAVKNDERIASLSSFILHPSAFCLAVLRVSVANF
jgi:hypothetical protein